MPTTVMSHTPYLAEQYLDLACHHHPVIKRIIERYGDLTLAEYGQQLIAPLTRSYQPREDLFNIVYQYVAPLLGEDVARRVIGDLETYPMVLTTNHHGVEYFSQSFQTRLIWSLSAITGMTSATTMLILACGNIPLNNLTYPQGILIYGVNSHDLETMPIKLPIFPLKSRSWTVSTAPAMNQTMISKVKVRVDNMLHQGELSLPLVEALFTILQEDYNAPSVKALPNYSQQAVVLNSRIWKRLFSNIKPVPDLAYLESEKIVVGLLQSDLFNSDSLVWRVLFDPNLRSTLLEALNGHNACWRRAELEQRFYQTSIERRTPKKIAEGSGTIFFWGIDDVGRKIPLALMTNQANQLVLFGIDVYDHSVEIPFTPSGLNDALQSNKLLPSVFITFLTLAFARGVICIGGYFQCKYLVDMQKGLVSALQNTPGYADIAQLVAQVPADVYLDGMLAIMRRSMDHTLIPAGPIEIIAGGGITNHNIEQMLALTVREAHLADMFDTAPDAVPPQLRLPGWKTQLAADCSQLFEGKIVIK